MQKHRKIEAIDNTQNKNMHGKVGNIISNLKRRNSVIVSKTCKVRWSRNS